MTLLVSHFPADAPKVGHSEQSPGNVRLTFGDATNAVVDVVLSYAQADELCIGLAAVLAELDEGAARLLAAVREVGE